MRRILRFPILQTDYLEAMMKRLILTLVIVLLASMLMAGDSDKLNVTLEIDDVCVARFMGSPIDENSNFTESTKGVGNVSMTEQSSGNFANTTTGLYASVRTNSAVEMNYKIYGTALTRYVASSSGDGQPSTNTYYTETIPLTVKYTAVGETTGVGSSSSSSKIFSNAATADTSKSEDGLVLGYENQPAGMKNLNWKLDLSASPTTTQQTAGDYIAYLTLEVGPAQA